jgi:prolyl oligopeptidase
MDRTDTEAAASSDPFLWLEEIEGERALDWVRAQNQRSLADLQGDPRYAQLEREALALIRDQDRLTFGRYVDGQVVNFWQDDKHVRGVWRVAPFEGWRAGSPRWETILDIDALAAAEGKNWTYQGAERLDPYTLTGRCLVSLSIGGMDAHTSREFDQQSRTFVADGFEIPIAKHSVTWKNQDTLLVATDWGEGTLTESGYPFVLKALQRGQALSAARELFRGEKTDMSVHALRSDDGSGWQWFIQRAITFFTAELYWLRDGANAVKLALPPKHDFCGLIGAEAIFSINQDWTPAGLAQTFKSGSLLSAPLSGLSGEIALAVREVYVPHERQALQGASVSGGSLLVVITDTVRGRALRARFDGARWTTTAIALPENGTIAIAGTNPRSARDFVVYEDLLTPPSVLMLDGDAPPAKVQSLSAKFDAGGLVAEQCEVASRDGARIPYFVVRRADCPFDGTTPALLYGYGGFEIPMLPGYRDTRGKLWLERGGAFVLANIRGGGEFGPQWHEAGLKTRRQVIYDDFIAVAEDLIARRLTSPRRLGIMGGSNGGLLMGVMMLQRPTLFRAVVVQVPLLDMLRYHKLLAGASWVDEYGHPDKPAERAFLEKISPYQNLARRDAHPAPLFVTSTKDDRVHPGHARKYAAKMAALGMTFWYYENIDGGHSAAANLVEQAKQAALTYVYLTRRLMD